MANTLTLQRPKSRILSEAAADAPTPAHVRVFAMLSHRGRVRHANEDACGAMPERGAFVVCDGMGGAAAGEVASHLAMEAFLDVLSQPSPNHSRLAADDRIPHNALRSNSVSNGALRPTPGGTEYPPSHSRARLEEAIRRANQTVFRHSRKSPSLHGMGTTLVALLFEDAPPEAALPQASGAPDSLRPDSSDPIRSLIEPHPTPFPQRQSAPASPTLWLAHVGDSRCYRFRSGILNLLTRDHSLVEEQVRAGVLSRVEAGCSPIRNIITRAIGSLPAVDPEIDAQPALPGDLYLLASDGLTRELDDAEIARILVRSVGPATLAAASRDPAANGSAGATLQSALDTACQALIDAANAKGGGDNITVLLVPCL